MTTKLNDIYGGRDPRDLPTYTLVDAARFLKLPPETLRNWLVGQVYSTRAGRKHARPVIAPAGRAPVMLSFWNLAEAYVLAGIRRQHKVSFQSTRKALNYVERKLEHKRPLIEQDFLTDGADLFIEKLGELAEDDPGARSLVNASKYGQLAARALISSTLKRVTRDTKGLIRLIYPWVNSPTEPRDVEIDPRRAFGRPVVKGTRIPTEELADRFGAGDSIEAIADDFDMTPSVVQSAIRWEMETGRRAAAA